MNGNKDITFTFLAISAFHSSYIRPSNQIMISYATYFLTTQSYDKNLLYIYLDHFSNSDPSFGAYIKYVSFFKILKFIG